MTMSVAPPQDNRGQRLLPSTIDEIAQNNPSRILYSIPKTSNFADGFQDIDARSFASAVDRCAWYLENTLGRGEAFPTLLYMGPQDVVYAILVCTTYGSITRTQKPNSTFQAWTPTIFWP